LNLPEQANITYSALDTKEEVKRQIDLNTQTNRRFFGKAYTPQGFFPPEMCYSQDILQPVIKSGYRWIILSGIACPVEWPMDFFYRTECDGQEIVVFFRDDVLSNRISFQDLKAKEFIAHLEEWQGTKREYLCSHGYGCRNLWPPHPGLGEDIFGQGLRGARTTCGAP